MNKLEKLKNVRLNSKAYYDVDKFDEEAYINHLKYIDNLLEECILHYPNLKEFEVTTLKKFVKDVNVAEIYYNSEEKCITIKEPHIYTYVFYECYPYELIDKQFLYEIAKEINEYLKEIGAYKTPISKMTKLELWNFVLENRQILEKK